MKRVDQTELLRLVEKICTIEDVKALLRKAKGRTAPDPHRKKRRGEAGQARVRITAENKDDLIYRNLADALALQHVTAEEVLRLVRDAEENGHQHIYYFSPKAGTSKTKLRFDVVGEALLGKGWERENKVPRYEVPEGEFLIADFREERRKGDWTLKLYGCELVTRHLPIKIIDGKKYIPINDEQERVVLVVRWRNPDLLEIRIPRNESKRRLSRWLTTVWETLKPAIDRASFKEWDLTATRATMIRRQDEFSHVYSTRDTRLFDAESDHRATFEGHVDAYDLFERQAAKDAIHGFIEAGDTCVQLGIKWHQIKDEPYPSQPLHTLLVGERSTNELIIGERCQPADVDYIAQRLREFSRLG